MHTLSRSCALLLLWCAPALAQGVPDAETALARSIAYHDPEGQWATFAHTLVLEERRPNGTRREVALTFDHPRRTFIYRLETDSLKIVRHLKGQTCRASLNGSDSFSEAQAERYRLTCSAIKRTRGYYLYLYGLPMKLRDPGTRLDPTVARTTFEEQDALALKVTYDPAVGADVWYFYLDPATYRLIGYRFYHDEAKNDGEYITLKDEYRLGAMRIPQTRAWYTHQENKHLGTDHLKSHRPIQ